MPKDPTDTSLMDQGISLSADASSSLQLNLNNLDPKDMDRIDVSIQAPHGIFIQDSTVNATPVNVRTWQLALKPDQKTLSLDFQVVVGPDIKGETELLVSLQPYLKNMKKPDMIERTVLIRVE